MRHLKLRERDLHIGSLRESSRWINRYLVHHRATCQPRLNEWGLHICSFSELGEGKEYIYILAGVPWPKGGQVHAETMHQEGNTMAFELGVR